MYHIHKLQAKEMHKMKDIIRHHAESAELGAHDPLVESVCFENLRQALIDPNFDIFVCQHDNEIVAYAATQLTQQLYNNIIVGNVVMFFVRPDMRSKTLSDQLWQACEDEFYATGAGKMQAMCVAHTAEFKPTVKFLDRAQLFYRSKGAECVGYIHMKGLA